jgi:DNA-binding MarR family transcriptional regulator
MVVTLDRMGERRWVERVRSTQDRRAQQIHLAAQGAEKIASTMENAALKVLSPAERALLIELLMKVAGGKPGKRG